MRKDRPDPTPDDEVTQTVRAPQPPTADEEESSSAKRTTVLMHDAATDRYRLRATDADTPLASDADAEGYREVQRFGPEASFDEINDALTGPPRYIVFENTDTGAVYYGRSAALSDNWTGGGRFDQLTFFDSEQAAAAYAQERQSDTAE